jgi:ribokinase
VPSRLRLAVVGSINLDLVMRVARLPRPGETLTQGSLERHPGGKGANQALAAARLGAEVVFVACIGGDDFGREAVRLLVEAGVALDRLKVVEGATGVAVILVADDGENQIAVAPHANDQLGPEDVQLGEVDAALCQLEVRQGASAAAASQAPFFCLNAAPTTNVDTRLVDAADLVVVNRYEFDTLPVVPRLTALTLGAAGAVLLENGTEVARATPPAVDVVDGTAAGDAFTACLVVSHLEGRRWDEALRRACAAGALAASRPGAQPSLPTAAEVDEILAA